MTAFADYIDLRTAVIEHVGRSDIADVMPRLLSLAETGLNQDTGFRLRNQITTSTLTFASGASALPSGFLEMIGVFNGNGCEYLQQSPASVQSGGAWYAMEGDSLIAPLMSGTLDVKYYAEITPLSTSSLAANWLLTKYPLVYLYALGLEAAKYVKDADLMAATASLLRDAKSMAKSDDTTARYSRARVRVAGPTP